MLNSIQLNILGITVFIYPFIIFIGVGFTHMFLGFTRSAKKHNISYSEIEKIHYIMVASILVGFFFAALSSQIFIKTESDVIKGACFAIESGVYHITTSGGGLYQ